MGVSDYYRPRYYFHGQKETDIYDWSLSESDDKSKEVMKRFMEKYLEPKENLNREVKPMDFGFENMGNMFKGMFAPLADGCCKLAMNGEIAVKTSNGYKTYNLKKKRLTNVGSFAFDMFNMFWSIPTNHVEVGDIILVNKGGRRTPRCVTKVADDVITAVNYEDNEVCQILPERHILMGKVYFYAKVFCPFKNMMSGGSGMGSMIKMAMMSQMLNGGNAGSGNMFGNMMPLMLMAGKDSPFNSIFGGEDGGNMFEGMFKDLDFSGETATEDDEVDDEEEK